MFLLDFSHSKLATTIARGTAHGQCIKPPTNQGSQALKTQRVRNHRIPAKRIPQLLSKSYFKTGKTAPQSDSEFTSATCHIWSARPISNAMSDEGCVLRSLIEGNLQPGCGCFALKEKEVTAATSSKNYDTTILSRKAFKLSTGAAAEAEARAWDNWGQTEGHSPALTSDRFSPAGRNSERSTTAQLETSTP